MPVVKQLVQIGSIVPCDNQGEVMWFDDFASGTISKWLENVSDATADIEPSAEASKSGTFSVKYTSADINPSLVGISHDEPLPPLGIIGVEVSFTVNTGVAVEIDYYVANGSSQTLFSLVYDFDTKSLYYLDKDLNPILITPADLSVSIFHTIKIVVDLRLKEFVRCILNKTTYSLAKVPARTVVSLAPSLSLFGVAAFWTGVKNSIFVDNAIVTLETG